MNVVTAGSRTRLEGADRSAAVVDIRWRSNGTPTALFVIIEDAESRLGRNEDVVFHRRTEWGGRSVVLRSAPETEGGGTHHQVQIDLASLPPDVAKLEFVVAARQAHVLLDAVEAPVIEVWDPRSGQSDLKFPASAPGVSKCHVVGLLERAGDGRWEFVAIDDAIDVDFQALVRRRMF